MSKGCCLLAVVAILAGPAAGEPDEPLAGPIAERIRGRTIAESLPPLEHPPLRPVATATHMRDDDTVLGIVVSGKARAYPWWIAKNHHVINDTVGGTPVAIAFCEQCTGAAAFRRELDGRELSLEVPGVYNGTIILRDRETGTLWAPFSGKGLEGPLAGRRLDRIPLTLTRWDDWKGRQPETEVVWGPSRNREGHGSWYEPGKWGIVNEMGVTIESWDSRLPENTLVYGVELAAATKAYPLSRTGGAVANDQAGPTPVVIMTRGRLEAAGYERTLGERILTFEPTQQPEAGAIDRETGSHWSFDGVAVGGPLKGQRLKDLGGFVVEWHVWSAYNPKGEIYGQDTEPAGSVTAGAVFPSLALPLLDGQPPKAIPFASDLNLVVLWAAWCPPCRSEMPALQQLAKAHAAEGLSAVGIAIHIPEPEEREAVRTFVTQAGIEFPIFLVDDAAYDRLEGLSTRLGRPGLILPTVFVTDRGRKILAVFSGRDVDSVPRAVEDLLRKASPRRAGGSATPPPRGGR